MSKEIQVKNEKRVDQRGSGKKKVDPNIEILGEDFPNFFFFWVLNLTDYIELYLIWWMLSEILEWWNFTRHVLVVLCGILTSIIFYWFCWLKIDPLFFFFYRAIINWFFISFHEIGNFSHGYELKVCWIEVLDRFYEILDFSKIMKILSRIIRVKLMMSSIKICSISSIFLRIRI